MDGPYQIRPAVPDDAAELVAIERRCFSDPWSEAGFRDALGATWTFGLVAETSTGRIAGYLVARELAGAGEILNLAVPPEFRRRGVARALLDAGIMVLHSHRVDEVFLEVRESNLMAQALYVGAGFRPVGQRAAYYRNPKEDALVLRLDLESGARKNDTSRVDLVD
jgi:ribosomal-protein-alanine N-acetyltransferase